MHSRLLSVQFKLASMNEKEINRGDEGLNASTIVWCTVCLLLLHVEGVFQFYIMHALIDKSQHEAIDTSS